MHIAPSDFLVLPLFVKFHLKYNRNGANSNEGVLTAEENKDYRD